MFTEVVLIVMFVKLWKWHEHIKHFVVRHPDWRIKLNWEQVLALCKATYEQDTDELEADRDNVYAETVDAKTDFINFFELGR